MGYNKLVRQKQLREKLLQLFLLAVTYYERSDTNLYSTRTVVPKLVVRVPPVVREGFQGGTGDPSVFLYKKNRFFFHLSASVNKFLHFCVLPLLVSKNGHYNFSQPFC